MNQIYKAFTKCIEDYQSEIKHSKIIIKEVNNLKKNIRLKWYLNLINNLASELLGKQRKRFTPKRTELKWRFY